MKSIKQFSQDEWVSIIVAYTYPALAGSVIYLFGIYVLVPNGVLFSLTLLQTVLTTYVAVLVRGFVRGFWS